MHLHASDLLVPLIFNDETSQTFRQELIKGISRLEPIVKLALNSQNYQIKAGRTMAQMSLPDRLTSRGFHGPTIQSIFVAEYYVHSKRGWTKNENPAGVLFHEIGHFYDLHLVGNGVYPHGSYSLQSAFKNAADADINAVKYNNFKLLKTIYSKHERLPDLLAHFQKTFMSGPRPVLEIYAETWCHSRGEASSMPVGFSTLMPKCTSLVRSNNMMLLKS
jgi:hypothetical protein